MYQVSYSRKAEKQLDHLPADVCERLAEAIHGLRLWPHHGQDVIPMKGDYAGHWRLRVGDHRAIFTVDTATREIEIGRIAPRGRAY